MPPDRCTSIHEQSQGLDLTKPVIGFIGLGVMGGNMVECLQKEGFELHVMDLDEKAVATVVARGGATEAASAAELAAAGDIVMLCLTTSAVVEKLVYADDGLLANMKEGSVLIDYGTSIPASTRKIGADLAAKGVGMIDAPLGRTPAHAKDGLLDIMAAGDRNTFDQVKPVLDVQGENVFHLGALGAGHTTKLIDNFTGMTTVCTMSQAFAVADRAGVDPEGRAPARVPLPGRPGLRRQPVLHRQRRALVQARAAEAREGVGPVRPGPRPVGSNLEYTP